jgi:hypothetical protein
MTIEEWKPIPGYGGLYEASSLGRVKAKARTVVKRHGSGKMMSQNYLERILNPIARDKDGYAQLHISVDKKHFYVRVHAMVLLAWRGPPKPGQECLHKNGVRDDNRPTNISWGTGKENAEDRMRHGNYKDCEHHKMAKLTAAQVSEIKASLESGVSLADKFKVSTATISSIRCGKTWKNHEKSGKAAPQ